MCNLSILLLNHLTNSASTNFLNSKLKTKNFRLRGASKRRSGATAAKLVAALLDWFAANARDLPWRRTRDPYAIWVSEIMLQQTQVVAVIPYYGRFLAAFPNPA